MSVPVPNTLVFTIPNSSGPFGWQLDKLINASPSSLGIEFKILLEFRVVQFDRFLFGETFREGNRHPHRQWSFAEDDLVYFEVAFREQARLPPC